MANTTEKTYRLTPDHVCPTLIFKVGTNKRLTVYDDFSSAAAKKNPRNRAIRHCPNEQSVFIDEQSEHAVVEPIIIEGGYITVPAMRATTQYFLNIHPDNVANGGGVFELVDDEKEAVEEISREELISELIQAVKDKEKEPEGVYELEALAAVLKGNISEVTNLTAAELKRTIYGYIQSDPERFINESGAITMFTDESIKRKYIVLRAINERVITVSADKRSIMWGNSKAVIVEVPRSLKPVDYFTDYLETNEGMLVLDEIVNRS